VSDERLRLSAQITHECPKLGSKSDLVLIVQFGNLNPVFVAADGHHYHSCLTYVLAVIPIENSGSPALSVIRGRQPAQRPSFAREFLVILDRRTAVFIGIAGEPVHPIGLTFIHSSLGPGPGKLSHKGDYASPMKLRLETPRSGYSQGRSGIVDKLAHRMSGQPIIGQG